MDRKGSPKLRPARGSAIRSSTLPNDPQRDRSLLQIAEARAALAKEYKGITVGDRTPGLFPVFRTGKSLKSIVEAARSFEACLTEEQSRQVHFDIDSTNWRAWHNAHRFLLRHGLLLDELDDGQRQRATNLIRVSLSATGYESARDVMRLNEHAREITGRSEEYGEWFYWISIFGQPSLTEPWGWQLDGHHLIINCFVLGDQIVMTPDFRGSEPNFAEWGKFAGTRVFEEEESRGLELMNALTVDQQRRAIIGKKLPDDVFAGAQVDNLKLNYSGVPCRALEKPQQDLLLNLIDVYVGRIRPDHAKVRMAEVKEHLPQTLFGWIGDLRQGSPFYYRVYSPVILIEFDHLPGTIWDNLEPTRNHIHTIVRTPNGNDYGRDLLRQHYEEHDHSHSHTAHRRGLA